MNQDIWSYNLSIIALRQYNAQSLWKKYYRWIGYCAGIFVRGLMSTLVFLCVSLFFLNLCFLAFSIQLKINKLFTFSVNCLNCLQLCLFASLIHSRCICYLLLLLLPLLLLCLRWRPYCYCECSIPSSFCFSSCCSTFSPKSALVSLWSTWNLNRVRRRLTLP